MVMGKRAQFFLLAAVIISAVVISLGITANRATVNREPGNFYDFSYEVKREVGAILDYNIYSGFDDDANLTVFINLLAEDIRDNNPDANFVFLYGNNEIMKLRNYGEESITVNGDQIGGSGEKATSSINIAGNYYLEVDESVEDFDKNAGSATLTEVGDSLFVEVKGYESDFPISRHKQVIFIIQKEVGDESFVAVS
jgi:hypothetical protein